MPDADPRIHSDLAHLAGLEARARGFDFLPRQPVGSALSGRRAAGCAAAGSSSRRSAPTSPATTCAPSTGR